MNWGLTLVVLTILQAWLVQSEKVIRVTPEVESHLIFLRGLEKRPDIKIDFWKEPSHLFQPVDIEVSEGDFITLSSLLEADGIEFKVQIDDVDKLIEGELETTGARRGYGGWHSQYHNLEEIHSKLYEVRNSYSDMTSIISLGRSHEGKQMRAIKIKGKYSFNKPVFFIECGIHAREWVSPATCMFIIDESGGSCLSAIVLTISIRHEAKCKELRITFSTANNSFDPIVINGSEIECVPKAKILGTGASSYACDSTFRGSAAFSEVETVNVRNYLKGLADAGKLKGFIDFHAYSQMWFIPWGYTRRDTPDHYEQMRVARAAANAITRKHGTRFQYGSSAALLYPAAGGSEDWTYGKLGVEYSFSVELRDEGRYGFLLPANQIIPTGEETFEGLKALVSAMDV
ncbi:hypothetical protein ACROYT_G033097 [Oculina patagonica]